MGGLMAFCSTILSLSKQNKNYSYHNSKLDEAPRECNPPWLRQIIIYPQIVKYGQYV